MDDRTEDLERRTAELERALDAAEGLPPAQALAQLQGVRERVLASAGLQQGTVVLDAGPFAGLGGVRALGEALRAVDGVAAVDVRALRGERAELAVALDRPVALDLALTRLGHRVEARGAGHLVVALSD